MINLYSTDCRMPRVSQFDGKNDHVENTVDSEIQPVLVFVPRRAEESQKSVYLRLSQEAIYTSVREVRSLYYPKEK